MMYARFFLAMFVLLALAGTADAATYYLDAVNGNDNNPGTSEQPWKTLGKAQSTVTSGDTVIVRNGSYGIYSETEDVTDRTDWVTYRAAAGHTPELTQISIDKQGKRYNVYLSFDGFTIRPTTAKTSAVFFRNAAHMKFLNLNVIGQGVKYTTFGIYGYGSYIPTDITIDHCKLVGNGIRRLDGFVDGIRLKEDQSEANSYYDDVTITNNEISQVRGKGIVVNCINGTIANNNVHYTSADAGIGIGAGNGPLVIENNRVHDNLVYMPILSETPTQTTWSADGKTMTNPNATFGVNEPLDWAGNIEINIASGTNVRTGDHDITVLTVVSPTQITFSESIKLDSNGATPSNVNYYLRDATHTDLLQVYSYQTVSNLIIRKNQFYDCIGGDEQIWWMNPINTGEPNDRGGSNFTIENNLFWNQYSDGQDEYNNGVVEISNIEGLVFRNNIVIGKLNMQNDGSAELYNNIISAIAVHDTCSLFDKINYNILNRGWIESPNEQGSHDTFFYPNQYAWGQWKNPSFVNIFKSYDTNDFTYASSTSSGVNGGDPTNFPSTDILGNPRDSQPDAGAYEFQGSTRQECIDNSKLLDYIFQWKQGSITMPTLMQKIAAWKAGTGC